LSATSTPARRPAGWRDLSPYAEFLFAVLAAGLWYTQGGAIWYAGSWPGPWPLALLGLAWAFKLARVGLVWRLTAMDLSLWLFLASAGVGVWAAYDRGPAWAVFWLIMGATGLYYAVSGQPDEAHQLVILVFWGLAGAAVALFFLATHDWSSDEAKVTLLANLGRQVQSLLPSPPGHRLSPNVAGGLLAMLFPLYLPLFRADVRRIWGLAKPWARLWPFVWALVAGVSALGWLISMSRGAWVGLLGACGLWALWRGARWFSRRLRVDPLCDWRLQLGLMTVLILVVLLVALVLASLALAGRLPGGGALANRLSLYRDALLLARDYGLIGAGLGMFQIQFSIYTLLIHVGYIIYSHNMLLSILIAQGLLGLLPYLVLLAATVVLGLAHLRRSRGQAAGPTHLIEAALCSLVVIFIHGLVDDVLYGSRGALLLFLPCALVAAAARVDRLSAPLEPAPAPRRPRVRAAPIALIVVALLGLAGAWRTVVGAWYANLGAIEQARIELGLYDPEHFDKLTMDQVRQQVDLTQAQALLARAKQVDPRNPTARQRLAAIDLSLARYPQALAEMQAAWDAGHRDSVTRLLYGDALVANGQPQRAAEVVRGLKWSETRLMLQASARYRDNEDYRRAADAWSAVSLLNPSNTGAANSRSEAEKHLDKAP